MSLSDWIAPKEEAEVSESSPVAVAVPAVPAVDVRASGYGCGGCGHNEYVLTPDGWKCGGCGAVFELIGGTRGPVFLN